MKLRENKLKLTTVLVIIGLLGGGFAWLDNDHADAGTVDQMQESIVDVKDGMKKLNDRLDTAIDSDYLKGLREKVWWMEQKMPDYENNHIL